MDIDTLISWFERYATQLPLELFVLVGAFFEEIVSPIPSFVVLIPAGAAAEVQGVDWWYLLPLGFIGAAGRVLASIILYFVADKAEGWLFGKGRRIFGVTHKRLENYGQRLSGTSRDFMVLFLLNAIPIFPTSLLSLTCGFIKIRFRLFVAATFFGSAVNAIIYMAIGYAGIQVAASLRYLNMAFQIITILLLLFVIGLTFYYWNKRRGR